ncbi:hypothetical protein NKDENANG_02958 [Candidatus Entotheonellaceae bacterium PAL068K]
MVQDDQGCPAGSTSGTLQGRDDGRTGIVGPSKVGGLLEIMKILLIPGLTLLGFCDDDVARIRSAAESDAEDVEVVLGSVPLPLFQAAPRLRWTQSSSSGVDAFLFPESRNSDAVLTSEKGLVDEHLADHGFGLLLLLTRQLATASNSS